MSAHAHTALDRSTASAPRSSAAEARGIVRKLVNMRAYCFSIRAGNPGGPMMHTAFHRVKAWLDVNINPSMATMTAFRLRHMEDLRLIATSKCGSLLRRFTTLVP